MSLKQQKRLEKVSDLLFNERFDEATDLLHQVIIDKARAIYESLISEEDDDEKEFGGDPKEDFTSEIAADKDDIENDELADGEVDDDDDEDKDETDEFQDDQIADEQEEELSTEERVEDLESQLEELRAQFEELMGEEYEEPNHEDLADRMDAVQDEFGDFNHNGEPDAEEVADDELEFDADEKLDHDEFEGGENDFDREEDDEDFAAMFEARKKSKLEDADKKKKEKAKAKKVDEETKFLKDVGDTGQRGKAKLVGTGKNTPLGAEEDKSPLTRAPAKPSYGGTTKNILGSRETGGEYGNKTVGPAEKNKDACDNVDVNPKNRSEKADTTPKWVGGKSATGGEFDKSPLTKRPNPMKVRD